MNSKSRPWVEKNIYDRRDISIVFKLYNKKKAIIDKALENPTTGKRIQG